MPKSHKRKNKGVGIDFKRAKRKVGKSLPKAANQTDTNFSSKSITLPGQSIAAEKVGHAVTHRNLTLKELVSQTTHYSEKVRLDALGGLRELISTHPEEGTKNAAKVVHAVAQRIDDADSACRSAARVLLEKALLPALGRSAVRPFVPVLMGHVCSALTHLVEAIRVDALRVLSLITEWRPDLVAAGYMPQVLQHFADALARPVRGRSLKAGSLTSLLHVVTGLHDFLRQTMAEAALMREDGNGLQLAYGLAQSEKDIGSVRGGCGDVSQGYGVNSGALPCVGPKVLMHRRTTWGGEWSKWSFRMSASTMPHSSDAMRESGFASLAGAGDVIQISDKLMHTLLECWSECSPGEFSTRPDGTAAQCGTKILGCMSLLLGHGGTARVADLKDRRSLGYKIIEKMDAIFPVKMPVVSMSTSLREQLIELNIAAAELSTRFLPFAVASSRAWGDHLASQNAEKYDECVLEANMPLWVYRVLHWTWGVMMSDDALPIAANDDDNDDSYRDDDDHVAFDETSMDVALNGETRGKDRDAQRDCDASHGIDGNNRNRHAPPTKLPPSVYHAALETVAVNFLVLPVCWRRRLFRSAWVLWKRSPVKSSVRGHVVEFLRRTVTISLRIDLYSNRCGDDVEGSSFSAPYLRAEDIIVWVRELPRFLWELGDASVVTTMRCLDLLLEVARSMSVVHGRVGRAAGANASSERWLHAMDEGLVAALGECQSKLAPLFAVAVPGRASKTLPSSPLGMVCNKRIVLGPLAFMPRRIQRCAIDAMYHLPGMHDATLKLACMMVCARRIDGSRIYSVEIVERLLDNIGMKAGQADPSMLWSLLLSLLAEQVSGLETICVQSGTVEKKMKKGKAKKRETKGEQAQQEEGARENPANRDMVSSVRDPLGHASSPTTIDRSSVPDIGHTMDYGPDATSISRRELFLLERKTLVTAACRLALHAATAVDALSVLGNSLWDLLLETPRKEALKKADDLVLLGLLHLLYACMLQDPTSILDVHCKTLLNAFPTILIRYVDQHDALNKGASREGTARRAEVEWLVRLVSLQPVLVSMVLKGIKRFLEDTQWILPCIWVLQEIVRSDSECVQQAMLESRKEVVEVGKVLERLSISAAEDAVRTCIQQTLVLLSQSVGMSLDG